MFEIMTKKVSPQELSTSLSPEVVVVVLSNADAPVSAFAEDLAKRANPLLHQSHEYLETHVGFLSESNPFILVEWNKKGSVALERRWLLNKLSARLQAFFSSMQLVVYLDETCGVSELVMAEDIYFEHTKHLSGASKFKSFEVWHHPQVVIEELDPHRQIRLEHHAGFRLWVNENPDDLTSLEIGRRLKDFAQQHRCSFTELGLDQLKEHGLNLLLAVGQASQRSPSRLYMLSYFPEGKRKQAPLMLVGKGITFDTGGINLKAHENLVNCMKNDMGGAALMANLFMALVKARYSEPLVLVIPTCENLIGENAVKPGAIIKSYAGKDVVIEHTDAEGRLILADAIAYANDVYQPHLTVCAATLTTAVLRQFGNFYTAVHFADDKLQRKLEKSAATWGELFTFWGEFLPYLYANHTLQADLTNMGRMPSHASMGNGSNVAAHFLKQFCPKAPFVHMDIFASTWNWSGDYPGTAYGATGAAFNSLFSLFIQPGLDNSHLEV